MAYLQGSHLGLKSLKKVLFLKWSEKRGLIWQKVLKSLIFGLLWRQMNAKSKFRTECPHICVHKKFCFFWYDSLKFFRCECYLKILILTFFYICIYRPIKIASMKVLLLRPKKKCYRCSPQVFTIFTPPQFFSLDFSPNSRVIWRRQVFCSLTHVVHVVSLVVRANRGNRLLKSCIF